MTLKNEKIKYIIIFRDSKRSTTHKLPLNYKNPVPFFSVKTTICNLKVQEKKFKIIGMAQLNRVEPPFLVTL
jgi:hypothetical protein